MTATVNHVEGPLGWTAAFSTREVSTMVRLGLITHVRTTVPHNGPVVRTFQRESAPFRLIGSASRISGLRDSDPDVLAQVLP